MTQRGAVTWSLKRQGGETVVALAGEITEDTDFDAILQQLGGPNVVLDLSGVRSINRPGVREWLKFVAMLERKAAKFELINCSVAVVQELNRTANFRGSGQVRSMFAPFYCPKCERDNELLIQVDATGTDGDPPPCPTCATPMEPSGLTLLLHLPSVNQT